MPLTTPTPAGAMTIEEILAPEDVLAGLRAPSKKALLESLAARAADRLGIGVDEILAPLARGRSWARPASGMAWRCPTRAGGHRATVRPAGAAA